MSNNRYEIREAIGKGGEGAVYRAFDTQLQRDVALKRILSTTHATEEEVQSAGKKLIEEAQTLSSLNHPNIVTVFDVGTDEEGGFVVMELLNGETLDETVARGVLTQEDFTEVAYQTMEALIAAQAMDVIHRDLKPPNVMVIWQPSGKFQTKILDFGLAKFSKAPSVQTMDQDDAVMGSIFFMAPEQFERAELDVRTDLYQIGCVYYHALTGQYPFRGETAPQVMNAHLQHRVTPLEKLRPDLAPSICQWVMWLVNRDMQNRPANAREALEFYPSNPEAPVALPAEAVVEPTQQTGSTTVQVVKAPSHDAAPPSGAVVASTTATGASSPVLRVGASATGASRPVSTVTGSAPIAGVGDQNITGIPIPPPKSRKLLYTLIGITSASILGAIGFVVNKKNTEAAEANRFLALSKMEVPTGSETDARLALKFLGSQTSTQGEKVDARKVLIGFEGNAVDSILLESLKNTNIIPLSRQYCDILSKRGYSPAAPAILNAFRKVPTSDKYSNSRISILNSLRQVASDQIVPEMLNELGSTNSQSRGAIENIVIAVLRQKGNGKNVTGPLLERVSKTKSLDERQSLFRILGLLGGSEVKTRVSAAFNRSDTDLDYKLSAMVALANWQNRDVLPLIADIATTSDNEALKLTAAKAYMRVAALPAPVTPKQRIATWNKSISLAGEKLPRYQSSLRQLFTTMMDYPDAETEAALTKLAEKKVVGGLAKSALGSVKKNRTGAIQIAKSGELQASRGGVRGDGRAVIDRFSESIASWTSPETWFSWYIQSKEGGTYQVEVEQATPAEGTSEYQIIVNDQMLSGTTTRTDSWETFQRVTLSGDLKLEPGEIVTLHLKAGTKTQPRMMNVKSIRLVKK